LNSLRDFGCQGPVLQTIEEDCELIASQTCNGVCGAQASSDPSSDGNQELIAGVVSQAVVYVLKAVEV